MQNVYAPGARVVIRDCEWIVRRADPSDDGGYILTLDGLSELVSGKSARFLTQLEEADNAIRVLDPAQTRFEQDLSPGFEKGRLFIETQLRQITPADDRIHLGHKAAMDPVRYQLDPARQALKQHRQRILIADAVGLGKTLEAGIFVTELMRRGRGKRILVLTLKSMMTQFQKELWNRFTIPLTRLDSAGLQRVCNNIPGNHNPFYYYDKSIITIDCWMPSRNVSCGSRPTRKSLRGLIWAWPSSRRSGRGWCNPSRSAVWTTTRRRRASAEGLV